MPLNPRIAQGASVSVIIPAMNAAPYVAQAVDSALSQTHPPNEVLVVDGGSRDGTQEIVQKFGARVRLLDQREYGRKGIGAGRNMGVAAAAGDWLGFLDADDWWETSKLSLQIEALSNVPDAVLSYTATWLVDVESGARRLAAASDPGRIWPSLRWVNQLNTSTVLAHRQTVVDAGAFNEQLVACEDWELWVRLRARGAFAAVEEPVAFYRCLDGSSTSWNLDNHLRSLEQLNDGAMLDGLTGWNRWSTRRRLWAAQLYAGALVAREVRPEQEKSLLFRSLAFWPSATFLPKRYASALKCAVGPRLWKALRPAR